MEMLVTCVRKVGFKDKETGKNISGTSIQAVSLEPKEDADQRGNDMVKTFISDDLTPFDWFKQVPAMYRMKYELRPVGRRVQPVLVGAELIGEILS